MGTSRCTGNGIETTTFTESIGNSGDERVVATVIWRGSGIGVTETRVGLLLSLVGRLASRPRMRWVWMAYAYLKMFWFRLRHVWGMRLRLGMVRLAPRQFRERVARRILPAPPSDGWTGSARSGLDGDGREVKYSRDRGVVRVRDREFALPAGGRTMVLLVDDDATAPGGVVVVETAVD